MRNTAGRLGWKIDTRARGGYVVGAGSVRPEGPYEVVHDADVAALPDWLAAALAPPPLPPTRPHVATVGINTLDAYVRAAVAAECAALRSAPVGTRHGQLHKAARILGEFVGARQLDETAARAALLSAAADHIGVADFTSDEAARTITDGLASGIQRPRRLPIISRHFGRRP